MARTRATSDKVGEASQTEQPEERLLLSELGWTEEQIEEARSRYEPFKDLWDAPGMDAYDAL